MNYLSAIKALSLAGILLISHSSTLYAQQLNPANHLNFSNWLSEKLHGTAKPYNPLTLLSTDLNTEYPEPRLKLLTQALELRIRGGSSVEFRAHVSNVNSVQLLYTNHRNAYTFPLPEVISKGYTGLIETRLTPEETTEYKIRVEGPGGTNYYGFDIKVNMPSIEILTPWENLAVQTGQHYYTRWFVKNAHHIEVITVKNKDGKFYDIFGPVNIGNPKSVFDIYHTMTSDFVWDLVYAYNRNGDFVFEDIISYSSDTIRKAPEIKVLNSRDEFTITPGQIIELRLETSHTAQLKIDGGNFEDATITNSNPLNTKTILFAVAPFRSTHYVLTAYGPIGATHLELPVIVSNDSDGENTR